MLLNSVNFEKTQTNQQHPLTIKLQKGKNTEGVFYFYKKTKCNNRNETKTITLCRQ
jgi:hypothetical protein